MVDIKFKYYYEMLGSICSPVMTIDQIEESMASSNSFPSSSRVLGRYQFTGLKDCEGVEIYEGDILEFDKEDESPVSVIEVKYEKELAGYNIDGYKAFIGKVIGNIHQGIA